MACPCKSSTRPVAANDDAGGEQRESDNAQEENNVARIEHAFGEPFEVRNHTHGGDCIDQPRLVHPRQQIGHRRKPAEHQEKTNDHRDNKADDLVAGHGGGHATDGQISARHQKTADVTRKNHAVVRRAKIVNCNDHRKSQDQSQEEENPRSKELSHNRLPGGDRHGQEEFQGADAPFFSPQPHADGRHQKKIKPWMPKEKGGVQRSLAALKKSPGHESKKSCQEQEYDNKNVGDRRGKIAAQFALGDGLDIGKGIHLFTSFPVSGRVMVRKTSSRRPSSVCSSSTCQALAASRTLRAKSPLRFSVFG